MIQSGIENARPVKVDISTKMRMVLKSRLIADWMVSATIQNADGSLLDGPTGLDAVSVSLNERIISI